MAHSAVHFSLGMLVGAAVAWLPGRRPCLPATPWAGRLGRSLLWSTGLGVWAIAPSLLRRLGAPDAFCDGWWMNLCMGYSLLNRLGETGYLPGTLALFILFGMHYASLLWAIRRLRNRR